MSQLHLNGGDPLKGKHEGPYKKHVQRLPYFRTPLKSKDGPWLEEGNMATVWLTLFYGERGSRMSYLQTSRFGGGGSPKLILNYSRASYTKSCSDLPIVRLFARAVRYLR